MSTLIYILVPLTVLVIGLLWKLRQANQATPSNNSRPVAGGLQGVHELIERGEKLAAVQQFMKTTGMGLKESKDAVELMIRGKEAVAAGNVRPSSRPEEDAELRQLIEKGNLIGAIKRYRDLTGQGLKESKDAVERMTGR